MKEKQCFNASWTNPEEESLKIEREKYQNKISQLEKSLKEIENKVKRLSNENSVIDSEVISSISLIKQTIETEERCLDDYESLHEEILSKRNQTSFFRSLF